MSNEFLARCGTIFLTLFISGISLASEEVSFKDDLLPHFVYECATCHQAYDPHGGLVIDEASTYVALVGVPSLQLPGMKRIEPGKPEQSYLYLKGINRHLQAGGSGWFMPLGTGMTPELADTLRRWIEQGAPNN